MAHNPGPSIYPFLVILNLSSLTSGVILYFNGWGIIMVLPGVLSLLFVVLLWGKDVMLEVTSGAHTLHSLLGLRMAFLLFIFTEVIFFVSIFWVYLDAALVPSIELGGVWPPYGITPPSYLGLPLFGTLVLLSRGVRVTWAHRGLLANLSAMPGFVITCLLALLFLVVQYFEYSSLPFTIADGVYGSIFYFSTGFHGVHVTAGLLMILYQMYWLHHIYLNRLFHIGIECAILYWHFVDVVWVLLYLIVYCWGS